ncbi:hypothetical protein G6F57_016428 [Rhizopus arrhizus]|nr:hypothetical protein G6F57_016428 [Rhizopus arrhizus]
MMQSQIDYALATPEILLLVFGLAILLVDAVSNHPERKPTFLLTLLALGVLTVVSAVQWKNGVSGATFHGLYVTDELSHLLKIASYIAVGATLVYGRVYAQVRDMLKGGELYVLTLFALLGQMVMISSGNLISIYLGLELMSLALYALIALRRDDVVATEAAMKYFVLGALASGFLLYGMSMVYGSTGHLDLAEISIVTAPANDAARDDAIKARIAHRAVPEHPDVERFLREAGFSKSQAAVIANRGLKHLLRSESEGDAAISSELAKLAHHASAFSLPKF